MAGIIAHRMDIILRYVHIYFISCLLITIFFLLFSGPGSADWYNLYGDGTNANFDDGTAFLEKVMIRHDQYTETLRLHPLVCNISGDNVPEVILFNYDRFSERSWISVHDAQTGEERHIRFLPIDDYVYTFGVANADSPNSMIYCMDQHGSLHLISGQDLTPVDTIEVLESCGGWAFFKSYDVDQDGFDEILGVAGETLFCVDTRTGDVEWIKDGYNPVPFAIVDDGESVYIVASVHLEFGDIDSDDTTLVSASTGEVFREFDTDISYNTRMVAADLDFDGQIDLVYVNDRFELVALDLGSFEDKWTIDISETSPDRDFALFIDEEQSISRIAVNHNLSMYDASTGELLKSFSGDFQVLSLGHFDGDRQATDLVYYNSKRKQIEILYNYNYTSSIYDLTAWSPSESWYVPFVFAIDVDQDNELEMFCVFNGFIAAGFTVLDSGEGTGYTIEPVFPETIPSTVFVEDGNFTSTFHIEWDENERLPLKMIIRLVFGDNNITHSHRFVQDYSEIESPDISQDVYQLEITYRNETEESHNITMSLFFRPLWGWKIEEYASIQVTVINRGGTGWGPSYEDIFIVEPDIELRGPAVIASPFYTIAVDSGDTIVLTDSIDIVISELKVVHEAGGKLSEIPYQWKISFKIGPDEVERPFEGRDPNNIKCSISDYKIDGDVTIHIVLVSLPAGTDCKSTFTVHISTDLDPPEFIGLFPINGTWFSERDVVLGAIVFEPGLGMENGMVQFSLNGDENWISVEPQEDDQGVWSVRTTVHLDEGWNSIIWRAKDSGGNGFAHSDTISIGVDLETISFELLNPLLWLNSTSHVFKVRLDDVNGSGIDLSSIEYRYSDYGLFNFDQWTSLRKDGAEDTYDADISLELAEGRYQYLQIRAEDIAGNQAHSRPYLFHVDFTPPSLIMISPDLTEILVNHTQTVSWNVFEIGSGMDEDAFEYRLRYGSDPWSSWRRVTITEMNGSRIGTFEVTFQEGRDNRLQARCADIAGNNVLTDPLEVMINSPPIVIISSPNDEQEIRYQSAVVFDSKGSIDIDSSDILAYTWISDIDGLIGDQSTFTTANLSLGKHGITLHIDDGKGHNISHHITITVNPEPVPSENLGRYEIILIIAIPLIAISIYLYYRRRNRDVSG